MCVKHKKDEDAEGCSDKIESKVPQNCGSPVGGRMDPAHKVEMFHLFDIFQVLFHLVRIFQILKQFFCSRNHLGHPFLDVEDHKGGWDKAERKDDANCVRQADPYLPAGETYSVQNAKCDNLSSEVSLLLLTSTPCQVVALYNSSGG